MLSTNLYVIVHKISIIGNSYREINEGNPLQVIISNIMVIEK